MLRFDPVEYLHHNEVSLITEARSYHGQSCLPSDDDFFWVHFMVQLVHGAMVVHVHCDLFVCLAMQDSER